MTVTDDEPWYEDDGDQSDGEDRPPQFLWTKCVVCGRGMNDEDQELETGMCLICFRE